MQAWEEKYYEREEGREEGREEEREEGIEKLLHTCMKFKVSREETAENLKQEYGLPDEKVQEYMDKYWE